jgi:hypothetical protein
LYYVCHFPSLLPTFLHTHNKGALLSLDAKDRGNTTVRALAEEVVHRPKHVARAQGLVAEPYTKSRIHPVFSVSTTLPCTLTRSPESNVTPCSKGCLLTRIEPDQGPVCMSLAAASVRLWRELRKLEAGPHLWDLRAAQRTALTLPGSTCCSQAWSSALTNFFFFFLR